ncbi:MULTISPECIES: hypothetical protein [Myroides]|uniref:hypothetical protein n=1 Tax=Myroides TaxID=76831 RepID=UPI000280A518|nr:MULTISPECIES: hypothetical protein [Myroides]EKB03394.1 hypothetical protein HMPREF9711_02721 [Myroides odoratimimus CCUG 3837]MDM1370314.1 hypothetical protein [Myroides marinus]MDM1373800.1 hypothetical protein [Myroides marinus]
MKKGNISNDQFSYKADSTLRFSNNNYILVVKDEDFPDRNVISIIYYDNGNVIDIDDYDMEKVITLTNNYSPDKVLSNFNNVNQILKISYGSIISNDRYTEGSNFPKCKTFASNIHPTDKNDIIEIFNGIIYESTSRIKLSESYLDTLILDIYVEENSPIFIETDGKIIGPFKVLSKDSEGYFIVEKHLWKPFGEYKLTDESYIEFTANELTRKIHLPSFNKLEILHVIDFKDDTEIIKEFKNVLTENSKTFDKHKIEDLLDTLTQTYKIKSIEKYVAENKRIAEILKNTEDIIISNKELAHVIPEINNIKSEIESLQNEKFELKNNLEKSLTRKDEIQQDIFQKQEKLDLLNSELENLSKTKEDELLKIKSGLESDITTLEDEKKNLENNIKIETEKKSKELFSLKEKLEELRKAEEDLKYSVDKLKVENQETQRDSLKGLIDLFKNKKYFDFFSGRDLSEYDKKEEREFTDFTMLDSYSDYIQFRTELISIFNKNGRNFETHFIDNLLISIHQNTLTVLAGLPGTGKTSLARLLVKILTPAERVSEVSVGRGWSSQKDLIGFQNPLTNKFHSAPTGIYELLSQLDYESKNKKFLDSPMAYIILDEANLSPIEHYWSTFYNLTDSTAKETNFLSISLGNNLSLEFANNLRFIATINYDQTTENLSPRVIDRANIIQIPANSFNIDAVSVEEVEKLNISYQKCIEFFNLFDFQDEKKNIELSDELNVIFNEIKKRFKTLRIPISPRVEIAIKQYCTVAKKWMKKEVSRPLDYCVAQRLLPMINLQGDSAKKNLEELLNIFEKNDLKKSHEVLQRIIETGNEDSIFEGNYNYFLTLTYA